MIMMNVTNPAFHYQSYLFYKILIKRSIVQLYLKRDACIVYWQKHSLYSKFALVDLTGG